MSLFKEKKSFFGRLSEKISDVIMMRAEVDEDLMDELEEILITSDIGMDTTMHIMEELRTKIKNDNWCSFFKKRIIRVIVPYIIWTIIYTMPSLISGEGILLLFKNLLTARAAGTLYYIFVYIQFVFLTPFLGLLANSKYRFIGWLVTPISIMIFKYYGILCSKDWI